MILLVDLCDRKHPLSYQEFVLPIARLVRGFDRAPVIRHYSMITEEDRNAAEGIILCGTALKDRECFAGEFRWLRESQIPMLGIGSGMQVMATAFEGRIEPGGEIGMTVIRTTHPDPLLGETMEFSAYELHNTSPVLSDSFQVLAASSCYPQVVRHQFLSLYGVLFHPEVRNEWVVRRFLEQCRERMN
jgi:GMP synthase (glutamine-hydrolysing)